MRDRFIQIEAERRDPLTDFEREHDRARNAFAAIFALCGLLLFLIYLSAQV